MQGKKDIMKASIEALERTCQKPYNLYSLLSCFVINKPIDNTLGKNFNELNKNYNQFSQTKLGQRIDALLEINEIGISEFEINRAQKISNESFKKIILGIFNIIDRSSKKLLLLDKNFIILFDELLNIL